MVTSKMFLVLALSLATLFCFGGDKQKASITLNLNGFDSGYVVFEVIQVDYKAKKVGEVVRDTLEVKGGKVSFYPPVENFAVITICFYKELQKYGIIMKHDSYEVNLFAYPNDKINVDAQIFDDNTVDYTLTGNKLNKEYSAFRKTLTPYYRISNTTMDENPVLSRSKEMQDKINKSLADKARVCAEYYNSHLTSPVSAFINVSHSYYMFPDRDHKIEELRPKALDSPLGVYYYDNVEKHKQALVVREEYRKLDSLNKIERKKMEENPAPDFKLKTVHGEEVTLSAFKGKYVVLDFWFVDCMFCPNSMERLKNYSKKFPGKFDVITINIHDSPDRIKTVVKDWGMENFVNTLDNEKAVYNMYKVRGAPTEILIYPDGKLEYMQDISELEQLFAR